MAEERIIDRLRRGEKVICSVCKKQYYDNDNENRNALNYFHCKDENCTGYVHEQKSLNID